MYGAATVVNDLVFTTTFDGTLHALDTTTGDEVWSTKLPAGTNATVAVAGDTLVTAASYPQGKDQQAVVVAYSLGANRPDGGTTGTTTGGAADPRGDLRPTCGSCHTLGAAGTTGAIGPNLDDLPPDAPTIEAKVRNGGGGMPAFGGRMSEDAIQAVAQYVAENAGSADSGDQGGGGP